jgi:hypothetical protein
MKIITGDIWSQEGSPSTTILVTTNSTINSKGGVVMGRGAAREAAERYPLMPFDLADRIKISGPTYGLIILPPFANGVTLGAFQVKHDWKTKADLDLISLATEHLRIVAHVYYYQRYILNFPGIGNGKLTEQEVLPIIRQLPDNITIYKKLGA